MKLLACGAVMMLALVAPAMGNDEAVMNAELGATMALGTARACDDPDFSQFSVEYARRLYAAAGVSDAEAETRIQEVSARAGDGQAFDATTCAFFTGGLRQGEEAAIANIRAMADKD